MNLYVNRRGWDAAGQKSPTPKSPKEWKIAWSGEVASGHLHYISLG